VYLPQVAQNASVAVNGEWIGGVGRVEGELVRRWVKPLLLTFPAGLLVPGQNVLTIRYATDPGAIGVISGILVGPDAELRPSFEVVYFVRHTLPQLSVLVGLVTGGVLALLAARRSQFIAYRWFAAGILLWTIRTIGIVLEPPPAPLSAPWDWLVSVTGPMSPTCFVIGLHRTLGRHRPKLEAVLLVSVLAGALLRAVVPRMAQPAVDVLWGMVVVPQGFYLVWLLVQAARERAIERAWVIALPALVALVIAFVDLQIFVTGRPLVAFPLFELVPPIVLLGILAGQIAFLDQAVMESETLNRELEQRVSQKHQELERNYGRMRSLERERAASEERDRIMRDMHDGMGAQLVSTLALVESEAASPQQIADALRDALDELRLMLDSLDPEESDLLAVLGNVRGRLEPRLARAGMRFEWRVRDVPVLAGFGPHRMVHVLRIVQEAISNAVRHAHARTIAIQTGEETDERGRPGVFVEVRDDGEGIDPGARDRRKGRGLANMQQRAGELGGRFALTSGAEGTTVRLWLPLTAA
jgi:signal transduction histidine kinase